MINDNENEAENEKKGTSIRYKYTKYKMCLNVMMVIGIKQHEKVKQHRG